MPSPYGNCDTKSLNYYDEYSISHCVMDCWSHFIKQECGCVHHSGEGKDYFMDRPYHTLNHFSILYVKLTHLDNYICICIHIHTCMRACVRVCVRTYVRTYIYTCTYMLAWMYTYINTYIHAFIHTYTHTYIHTYTHTHTHTPTHTHTHTKLYWNSSVNGTICPKKKEYAGLWRIWHFQFAVKSCIIVSIHSGQCVATLGVMTLVIALYQQQREIDKLS